MKISVVSDLHLEFGPFDMDLPGGDILLLAGDILMAKGLRRPDSDSKSNLNWKLFQNQIAKYGKIYMVMGNHEHYGSAYTDTLGTLRDAMPNIVILENDIIELSDNVVLFGSSFWTDFKNLDWFVVQTAKRSMYDYTAIMKIYKSGDWGKFHPDDAFEINATARLALNDFLIQYNNKECLVMTHHCPSSQSSHAKWGGPENLMNYLFYNTGLEELILDNPNLTHWFHGHTHDSMDYKLGECRVICNPRGYHGVELNPNFNPNLQVEIN